MMSYISIYIVIIGLDCFFIDCFVHNFTINNTGICFFKYSYWNTGLVSSRVSLTSWGEGTSLAFVGHPSSDSFTINIPYGLDILLDQPALHPYFSCWVG